MTKKTDPMEPLVSVKVVTYNHVKFIRKCLDSILMQKTNFPFEIVVGEDFSTDGTREIVFEYEKRYPETVRVITSDKNVGVRENGVRTRKACNAKYLAMCDGDDYWIDNTKLQKQVDFLESNPDYAMVFSDNILVDENDNEMPPHPYYLKRLTLYKSGFIFWDLFKENFINTSTVCVRNKITKELDPKTPEEEKERWFIFDHWYWLMIGQQWKIQFIDKKVSAYRTHENNISSNISFFKKRSDALYIDVVASLDKQFVDTAEKKQLVQIKLLAILYKRKSAFKYKLKAIQLLVRYKPDILFVLKKMYKQFGRKLNRI